MNERLDITGHTIEEFIEDELIYVRDDALAFGDIEFWGRDKFKFDDSEIKAFLRKVITALLQQGVKVVRPVGPRIGFSWKLIPEYCRQ